jgi:hypothetical protein
MRQFCEGGDASHRNTKSRWSHLADDVRDGGGRHLGVVGDGDVVAPVLPNLYAWQWQQQRRERQQCVRSVALELGAWCPHTME